MMMRKKWLFSIVGIVIAFIVAIRFIPFFGFIFLMILNGKENPERDQQLTQEAIAKGDFTTCNKVAKGYVMSLASPRTDCYRAVIKKISNKEICTPDVLHDIISIDECLGIIASNTHDVTLCAQIDPGSREAAICFGTLAKTKNDPTLCGNIHDENLLFDKGNCYGGFVTREDTSVCEDISETFVKETCYRNYLEIGDIKPEFCERNFIATQKYKNECFFIAARKTKNPALCDKIQGESTDYDKRQCQEQATNEFTY